MVKEFSLFRLSSDGEITAEISSRITKALRPLGTNLSQPDTFD